MDSEAASLRVETGAYDEAADLLRPLRPPPATGSKRTRHEWQRHGSGAIYGRVMKNRPRRDTLKPSDAGDFSRGREAPMVITPRALVDLVRQLAGRRAGARQHAKGVDS